VSVEPRLSRRQVTEFEMEEPVVRRGSLFPDSQLSPRRIEAPNEPEGKMQES
jgi:hypothetical protein